MEYANHLSEYDAATTLEQVRNEVETLRIAAQTNYNADVYKFCYSAIDLTTLSSCDSEQSVAEFARRAAEFTMDYPHLPNVASICVYPPFVETVGLEIDATPLRITSVAGGFPSSQTFLEVKMLEVAMAIENGADEVDVVLNVGKIMSGSLDEAANEIEVLREESEGATLKVILETGALQSPELVRQASLLAMQAGADFIKTSTGFSTAGATKEDVALFAKYVGKDVRIKAAGGISSLADAEDFINLGATRLGTSRIVKIAKNEESNAAY